MEDNVAAVEGQDGAEMARGGANNPHQGRWKITLRRLKDKTVTIMVVTHYLPLVSYETILNYLRPTRSERGLVRVLIWIAKRTRRGR